MCFIFLNKQEKGEIVVIHEPIFIRSEFSRFLTPNSIDRFIAQSMSIIFPEVLNTDVLIMIKVKLIKFTVDDVEVFINEEVSNRIDFFFIFQSFKSWEQFAVFEVSIQYFPIIIPVQLEQNPLDYCTCIFILELWSSLQKFKSRVLI